MSTLHIENTVRDYESWKATFDKFDRFRAERRVRSYRVSRLSTDPQRIHVDLEFDNREDAEDFAVALQKVWASPQSRAQMVGHAEPVLLELMEERIFSSSATTG